MGMHNINQPVVPTPAVALGTVLLLTTALPDSTSSAKRRRATAASTRKDERENVKRQKYLKSMHQSMVKKVEKCCYMNITQQ